MNTPTSKLNTVRLNTDNVFQYIGKQIIFKHNKEHIIARIVRASDTGKTIYIDIPRCGGHLVYSRSIDVIL